jgi:hypothetical protein
MRINSNEDMNENFYLNYSNCKLDDPSMSLMNSSKKNPLYKPGNSGKRSEKIYLNFFFTIQNVFKQIFLKTCQFKLI